MSRSIKDSEQTKKKILMAAINEFAEKGFNGARMSSIAAKAGVNQALLHYHFESKENLYHHIFQVAMGDGLDLLTVKIRKEIESWNAPPEIGLAAILYIMVCTNIETNNNDLNRIYAREIADGQGFIHDFARKYMFPRIMLFENFIKKGIKLGCFEISNPLMFSISIISFISDYIHGEDFIKDTKWHKELYKDRKKTLYNYLIEAAIKTLTPAGKTITPPVLSKDETAKLDFLINEIAELYQLK
mgnify:CR=1 FL=1